MSNMNSGPKADGPPVALRKALEVVKKAAQAHIDAIKTAEVAFSSALAQLAQDQRKLKQERQAFERERAELGGHGGEEPKFEEDEEVAEPLDGDEEAQQMQHDSAEEEPPLHDDEDGGEGPEGGPGWKAGGKGRAMDRSRSRDRRGKGGAAFLPRPVLVAPPPAAAPAQLVLQAIDRLRLDENATRAIKMFPPEQALDLLGQVGENVRNPSAFVTTMCNRTMQDGPGGPPRPPSEFERLEAAIADMGLDESATRVLHELPPDAALNLLTQVDAGVRNPSAFVMSLAHRALKQGGGPWQGPSLPELVEQNIARLRLDESATRMLHELPPDHAMDIIDQIGEDVRNPSAFVTAEVRKVMHGGGGPRPYDQGPPRGAPNPRDLSQQVASLAKALDLDSDCLDALLSISTQEAVMILERLANTASNIRNRSAFVFAEVKKRKQAGSTQGPPPPPIRHGPTKSVPCKFWAEGRCKNGSECRFAHD